MDENTSNFSDLEIKNYKEKTKKKKFKIFFSFLLFLLVVVSVLSFYYMRKSSKIDLPIFSLNADLGSKNILVPDDFPFISEGVNVNSLESFNKKKGLHTYTARWNSDLSGKEVYNRLFEYAKSNNWEVLPGEGEDTYYIQAGKNVVTFVAFITGLSNPFVELTFYQTESSSQ